MTVKLSLRLALFVICAFPAALPAAAVLAQPAAKAMPVTKVEEESLPLLGNAPVVVELFSSQACVFCPRADQLFADILQQENVIGLACHVDYFDVKTGSLSQPFCSERQSWYMQKLFAGPNYTPQMVINGQIDVVGYKFEQVVSALQKSKLSEVQSLEIVQSEAAGTFKVQLPQGRMAPDTEHKLWLALYDRPHELVIAEGMNRGKRATYYNIVSQLGSTDKLEQTVYVTPPLKDHHAGFAVILQDMTTGRIIAAGRHKVS